MLVQLIAALTLTALGFLGAASFIIERQPNAKQIIDRVLPYGGVLGILGVALGIIYALEALLTFRLFMLVAALLLAALGLLFGYALLSQYVLNRSAEAQATADRVRGQLAVYQTPLGIAGVIFGLWWTLHVLF